MSQAINVGAAVGRADLIGATAGRKAAQALAEAVKGLPASPWLAFDFSTVDMVSASAAREAFLGQLMDDLLERGTLPVFVALNQEALDEVSFAAQAVKRPLVAAQKLVEGLPVGLKVLGGIEPKQLESLRAVAQLGETDAKTAHEAKGGTDTGVTAWNNRLATLSALGLLTERKSGKTKYYSLTLKGLVDGN
jgi:hypothetical protein